LIGVQPGLLVLVFLLQGGDIREAQAKFIVLLVPVDGGGD
jgi:hypothetical protein